MRFHTCTAAIKSVIVGLQQRYLYASIREIIVIFRSLLLLTMPLTPIAELQVR